MKIMSKSQEQQKRDDAFRAGVEHTIRWMLEHNVIIHGPDGYGSDKKECIDLGKADEVTVMVDEVVLAQEVRELSTELHE